MLRTLLVIAVLCGMNTSLCTGGALTIASELSHITQSSTQQGPMSYGSIGYLSCASSPSAEDSDISASEKRCEDASTCLSQLEITQADRSILSFVSTCTDVALHPVSFSQHTSLEQPIVLARAGPLHEQAKNTAHILLKRE